MARRDDIERHARRAGSGSEEALARIEREVVRRGGARYRVIVFGRKPGDDPPAFGAEPVVCDGPGGRRDVLAWSIPVATAGGIWSALREHGQLGAALHDSVMHEMLPVGREKDNLGGPSMQIYSVRRLDVPAVHGKWTSTADVLCGWCAEGKHGPRVVEVPEYSSVTRCDACGAWVVVDWKVGNEHEVVLALREMLGGAPGFADPLAVMEQTGGMCSALSVRFEEDPRLSLWLVVDEESAWDDPVFLPWLQDDVSGDTAGLPGAYRTAGEIARLAMDLVDPARRHAAYRENSRLGHD